MWEQCWIMDRFFKFDKALGCVGLSCFGYWNQLILAINPNYHGSTQHFKSCSGLINIKNALFTSVRCFQLCLCPACSSSPHPPNSCLLFVHNIHNCPIFEPIPSCLCVHVNVEMTSIVELFSGRFSFSVKSGMWTDQRCPFRAVACAACLLLITLLEIQV